MQSTANRSAADERKDETGNAGKDPDSRSLEVSGAQVAGGAAATMIAAFLASSLGVYGTIIGAGVVSVGATAGGAVFQHVFRRTGEQIREVAVTAPKALHQETARLDPAVSNSPERQLHETQLLTTVDQLPPGELTPGELPPRELPTGELSAQEYGTATTHGTRTRGWRRIALVAAGTFLVVMGVVVGIEKLTGGPLSNVWGDDRTGTSFSPGNASAEVPQQQEEDGTSDSDSGSDADSGTRSDTGSDADSGTDQDTDPGSGDATAPATGDEGGERDSTEPTDPPTTGDEAEEETTPTPSPEASETGEEDAPASPRDAAPDAAP